jgi:hypothetical protein
MGLFCLDKNASILENFHYNNFHNRDIVIPEDSKRIVAEYKFQYGKG